MTLSFPMAKRPTSFPGLFPCTFKGKALGTRLRKDSIFGEFLIFNLFFFPEVRISKLQQFPGFSKTFVGTFHHFCSRFEILGIFDRNNITGKLNLSKFAKD